MPTDQQDSTSKGLRLHKADAVAPEFEAIAIELWTIERWNRRRIYQDFCRRYGDTVVSRSAFYRWFAKVLAVGVRDETIRKQAAAMVAAAAEGRPDVKEFAHNLAVQAVARLLYETPEGMDPQVLLKAIRALDQVKRTDLAAAQYRDEVQARAETAAKEAGKKLAEAGMDKPAVEDLVRSIYGIAGPAS
jgi:MoxR-like ATPase